MTFFLFLGFLAFAKGLRMEEGSSMEAEFEPISTGPNTGCITCDDSEERYSCHGYVIIKTNENGNEVQHGKIDQAEEDTVPDQIYELKYKNVFRGFRRATKIIETQGNCCWKFYERKSYAGDDRIFSNSQTREVPFAPRSLKLVEC